MDLVMGDGAVSADEIANVTYSFGGTSGQGLNVFNISAAFSFLPVPIYSKNVPTSARTHHSLVMKLGKPLLFGGISSAGIEPDCL